MSGHARSKVNLHLANCRELAQMANNLGIGSAVTSSLCLQLELALGFYLMEILQVTGKRNIQPWPVSAESLSNFARQFDSADIKELSEISLVEDSWMWRLLRRLEVLRQADSGRPIKAEIFLSDLEAPAGNLLIATSAGHMEPSFDLESILADLDEFASLVSRQRTGHEEY